MIKIFNQTDKNYLSNGDVVLLPLKAKVHKEDNGEYYLDFECGLDYIDYIVEGNIIVAPTPSGEQAFRIGNVEKSKTKLKTKAYHVFYDSKNYLIVDSYVVDKTCAGALNHLLAATEPANPYGAASDITTIGSYRCVRTSLHDAIFEVLSRWGGHLVRDNFAFAIWQSIGQDNGVVIRYAKNLKEISSTEDWTDVVTKLLPTGRDGIMLNALDPHVSIYLESSTSYALPYTKAVSFDQDIDENNYQNPDGTINQQAYMQALVDDLRAQATAYLNENCVPKVNYTLKANIQQVTDIGDSIEVIDERLGIDIFTNVIAYDYDCILGQYTEIEFGNFTKKLSNYSNQISAKIDAVETQSQQSSNAIWDTLEKSYVVYSGDKILVLESLPEAQATDVLKIGPEGIGSSNAGTSGTYDAIIGIDGTVYLNTNKLLIDSEYLEDFIISDGTSSGWHKKEYKSGSVELDTKQTLNSLTWASFIDYQDANSQTVDLLYSTTKTVALPIDVANAKVTATISDTSDAWVSNVTISANELTIQIISNDELTSVDVSIHVQGEVVSND